MKASPGLGAAGGYAVSPVSRLDTVFGAAVNAHEPTSTKYVDHDSSPIRDGRLAVSFRMRHSESLDSGMFAAGRTLVPKSEHEMPDGGQDE
jgi:hypothetical protein